MSNINQLVTESIKSRLEKYDEVKRKKIERKINHPNYKKAVNIARLTGLATAAGIPLATIAFQKVLNPDEDINYGSHIIRGLIAGGAASEIVKKSYLGKSYPKKGK